jgi:uncharacterized membrane protein HdeD (DUF308 family)
MPTSFPAAATETRLQRHLRDHWKSYAIEGVIAIVVGILAILAPFAAALATTLFIGWVLVIGGILGIISAVRAYAAPGFWANLALAVISTLLGLSFVIFPLHGAITLTWVLAIFLVLSGFMNFAIARAFRSSTGRFWLVVLSGLIDIILALILVFSLPLSAIWAIGLLVGISFLTSGFSLLFAALDAREKPL